MILSHLREPPLAEHLCLHQNRQHVVSADLDILRFADHIWCGVSVLVGVDLSRRPLPLWVSWCGQLHVITFPHLVPQR